MAFSIFKNPFESLSAEAQSSMVKSLEDIKDYFFKGNTIVDAINGLSTLLTKNIQAQDKLTQILLKRQEKQMTDKDQKEMINTMKLFGPAMERIVGAIKDYSKVPEDAVDKFILAIEKIAKAFESAKDSMKTIQEAAKGLMFMALAIVLFGLALLIAGPIYIMALPGMIVVLGVVFGTLYLFTKILPKDSQNILNGAKALLYMAAAILVFGLALYLAGFVYAQLWKGMIGIIPILMTIGALIFIMRFMSGFDKTIKEGAMALLIMAGVIGLVGLILFLAGLVYGELWKGFVGMIAILLTVGALVVIMSLLDMMSDTIMDGVKALLFMVYVIGITGLILFLASFIYAELWKGFVGMIAILLTIGALIGLMFLIDMLSDTIMDGVRALGFMVLILFLTGVVLYLASIIYKELWEGTIGVMAILLVIGALVGLMFLIDMMSDSIYDGALALLAMVVAFGLTALVLYLISDYADEMMAGLGASWPILILIVALVGIMFLLDKLKTNIIMGALSLGVMAVAVLVLAGALYVLKAVEWTSADSLSLSVLLLVLALVGTVLGALMQAGLLPLLGAAALAAIGLAILPLAFGLKIYKESGWTDADTGTLSLLVTSLGLIATVLGNPFTNFMTLLGAAAMVVIGAAMVDITTGLKTFKESGWKDSDNESFVNAMASVVKGFAIMWDKGIQAAYGLQPFDSLDVYFGVKALSGVGNIMTSMAKGLKDFASMQFVEFEVVKDKDGNAVVQPKAVYKLTNSDIENAAKNFAFVINTILNPIKEVGKAEMEASSWFSGGAISTGIKALTGVGNIMTDMAKGIQSFADLKFTTYKVVDGGTANAKIVPESIVQLTDAHFKAAGDGFGKIVSAILDPIKNVGKAEMESSSWFSDGAIKNGIAALTGIGNIMTEVAKGVQSFANLEFTTYEVVNAGTADAKVVPKGIFKVGDAEFAAMQTNFGKVLNAFLNPFILASAKIDENEDEIETAMEYFGNITKSINEIADAAKKWATDVTDAGVQDKLWSVFPVMDSIIKPVLYNALKVKENKDVIDTFSDIHEDIIEIIGNIGDAAKSWVTEITDTGVLERIYTMPLIIDGIVEIIRKNGQIYNDNKEAFLSFLFLFNEGKGIETIAKIREEAAQWANFQNPERPGYAFEQFTRSVFDAFRKPDYVSVAARYQNFTNNMEVLIKGYDKIQKVAESFERIAEAFGEMKEHINGMELERLTQVTNLMGFLDNLANGSANDIVADVGEALIKGMETLKDILMEIKDQLAVEAPSAAPAGAVAGVGPGTTAAPTQPQQNQPQKQDMSSVVTAINNLKTALTSTGIKIKDSGSSTPVGKK